MRAKRPGHDTESPLLAEVRLLLGCRTDIKLLRINTGSYRALRSDRVIESAPAGTPDLLGCWRGHVTMEANHDTKIITRWSIGVKPSSTPGPDSRLSFINQYNFGQFIAIETKSRYGPQRQAQKDWQAAFESVGGIYILARTVADVLAVVGVAI